jgi:hypothetical protein
MKNLFFSYKKLIFSSFITGFSVGGRSRGRRG